MNTVTTKEHLAEKYAVLKAQITTLTKQLEVVRDDLLAEMKSGDRIATAEYNIFCQPGRSSIIWKNTEAKKEFENKAIDAGLADIKIGDPYIQIRFNKMSDDE